MKKISYLMSMAVALLMGFASCSNDDNLSSDAVNPGGETAVEEGLPAKVTISLVQPEKNSSVTRAASEESTATDLEKKIENAVVFVFKESDINKGLEKAIKIGEFKGGIATKTVQITTGKKLFYAALNLPKEVLEGINDEEGTTTLGENLSAIQGKIMEYAELKRVEGEGENKKVSSYLLSTIPADVNADVNKDNSVAQTVDVPEDVSKAQKIKLQVGRAFAKIQVSAADEFTIKSADIGKITNLTYKVINKKQQTYMLPQFDTKNYLKTPNYEVGVTEAKPKNMYIDVSEVPFKELTETDYVPENSTTHELKARATNVMVRGVFVPKPEYLYDLNGKSLNSATPETRAEGDFAYWVFKNGDNVINAIFKASGNDINQNEEGKTVVAFLTKEAKDKLVNIYREQSGDLTVFTYEKLLDKGYKSYLYNKGYVYYLTQVLDTQNNSPSVNILEQVTVYRNKFYQLTVNSISGLGNNTSKWDSGLGEVTPQDPGDIIGGGDLDKETDDNANGGDTNDKDEEFEDDKDALIEVSVTPVDWTVVKQGIDF